MSPTITLPARVIVPNLKEQARSRIQDTRRHEARHAGMASLLQFRMTEVRADYPDKDHLGRVRLDLDGENWTSLRSAEFLTVLLAGGPPAWPPRAAAPTLEERRIAELADLLNLNEKRYDALVDVTRKALEHPGMAAGVSTIETMLQFKVLDGLEAERLWQIAFEQTMREHAHEADPHYKALRQSWYDDTASVMRHSHGQALRAECTRIAKEFAC